MADINAVTTVDTANIESVRAELAALAPEQAAALEPGCLTWLAENAEGFTARLTLWPDRRTAAIAADTGSFWGTWDSEARRILLSNGDRINVQGGVGEDA